MILIAILLVKMENVALNARTIIGWINGEDVSQLVIGVKLGMIKMVAVQVVSLDMVTQLMEFVPQLLLLDHKIVQNMDMLTKRKKFTLHFLMDAKKYVLSVMMVFILTTITNVSAYHKTVKQQILMEHVHVV